MKGIIVIDEIPKCCYECNMLTEQCECLAMDVLSVEVDTEKEKPDWCPIKPVSAKMEKVKNTKSIPGVFMEGRVSGWNDCIDEILKGHNL